MLAYRSAVDYLQLRRNSRGARPARREPAELVTLERLMPSAVATLTQRLGLPEADVVKAAGMAARTWHTRKAGRAALSAREADGVLRIARIAAEAVRVLGSEERARRWLTAPSAPLGARTPFSLLDSDAGAQAVEEALGRIHWGDTA